MHKRGDKSQETLVVENEDNNSGDEVDDVEDVEESQSLVHSLYISHLGGELGGEWDMGLGLRILVNGAM